MASLYGSSRILGDAPKRLPELPAWFAGLSDEDFQHVWVMCIVEHLLADEVDGVSQYAEVLAYIRDRSRGHGTWDRARKKYRNEH